MGMLRFLAKRLALLVLVLLGATVITFVISHAVPSDPARMWAGPRAGPTQLEQARRELGLDQPLYIQLAVYISRVFRGDLGVSIHTRRPVLNDIAAFFPATFELTTFAMIIALALGIPMGVVSATRRDRLPDHAARIFSLTGVSVPIFWLGLLAQLVLSSTFHILPTSGRVDSSLLAIAPPAVSGLYLLDALLAGNWPFFASAFVHILLPALTLSYASLAIVTRMTRSTMLEVLGQDYIRTARMKGLPERAVLYKHALKNALIPILTIVSLCYGFLLAGAVLVETIFDWPGMGLYATNAILTLDLPAIIGVTLIVAVIYVMINLVVDILYTLVDPRVRYD